MVIDHVPAQVCNICGDVLLSLSTVRSLEELLDKHAQPVRTAAVYDYEERAAG